MARLRTREQPTTGSRYWVVAGAQGLDRGSARAARPGAEDGARAARARRALPRSARPPARARLPAADPLALQRLGSKAARAQQFAPARPPQALAQDRGAASRRRAADRRTRRAARAPRRPPRA